MSVPTLRPNVAFGVAAASFVFNFACQLYGMSSTPSMKDVADEYHALGSPYAPLIVVYFLWQAGIQLNWLFRIYKRHVSGEGTRTGPSLSSQVGGVEGEFGEDPPDEAIKYAPVFALGNFAIGLWMLAWNSKHLVVSLLFVLINSGAQLFYVFGPLGQMTSDAMQTHLVAKMFAAIGILDIVDNASSAFFPYKMTGFHPGLITYVLALFLTLVLAAVSDAMFGVLLTYCYVALTLGQLGEGMWALVLVGCTAIIAASATYRVQAEWRSYRVLLGWEGGSVV
ncbi:hypothetical protein PYCC9005_005821 [Savitreella phatthalungensis]